MAKTYSADHFNASHFNNSAFPGGGSGVTPPTGCVGLYYAERIDIELAFGSTNVSKWADVENTDNATEISDRICWALKNSHYKINDKLTDGLYVIPFVVPYPAQITMCCAKLAAVYLYDSRGVTDMQQDGKAKNQMSFFRKECDEYLRGLLSGRYKLDGVDYGVNTPFISESPKTDITASRLFGSKSCSRS